MANNDCDHCCELLFQKTGDGRYRCNSCGTIQIGLAFVAPPLDQVAVAAKSDVIGLLLKAIGVDDAETPAPLRRAEVPK